MALPTIQSSNSGSFIPNTYINSNTNSANFANEDLFYHNNVKSANNEQKTYNHLLFYPYNHQSAHQAHEALNSNIQFNQQQFYESDTQRYEHHGNTHYMNGVISDNVVNSQYSTINSPHENWVASESSQGIGNAYEWYNSNKYQASSVNNQNAGNATNSNLNNNMLANFYTTHNRTPIMNYT